MISRKTTRRVLMVAIAVSLLGAQPAQAALPDYLAIWFPFWFAKKDDGPKPEETLQAPFANSGSGQLSQDPQQPLDCADCADDDKIPEYSVENPDGDDLSIPHRQASQIGDWLVRATSEIFTMDTQTYSQHMELLATGMSPAGLAEFQKFLIDSNVLAEMQNNDMVLKGFVDEAPLLLNEGALNGRYRWLFEMPVTLTFLKRTDPVYRKDTDVDSHTYHFIVQTQVGRINGVTTEDGVIIETWRVRQGTKK